MDTPAPNPEAMPGLCHTETPLVSVVLVTWNRREDTLEAVRSVEAQGYRHFEVVVVDNGSTDGTAPALREAYPVVRLVRLDRNLGAAGGRNPGIAAAQGEIIFLLDSDASLAGDTLDGIVRRFQAEPDLGIITCRIINAYTSELDGWIFTERDKADQHREFASYSFCSAGCAIRRDVFAHIGTFWERLFIYREEDDLALRAWDAGYRVIYWPEAVVYHRTSPERRVNDARRQYYDLRNSLYIYLVRYTWWMLACFVPLKVGLGLVKGIRKRCLGYILRALLDVTREAPSLLEQRHPISNITARRYLRLQREHGPLRWDLRSWLSYKA
jgi:GT2 family glycosyltransferase